MIIPARGYILGCHSFSLEETGDYQLSESAGRQGLELAPDDAWGLHAVTHVYDMTANAKSGIEFLSGRESAWSHCNNFRYHVWWHKALMHLDLGDIESVLHLYDAKIRSDKTDDYRDISNATSLLSRLELHGVDVSDRWEELADISVLSHPRRLFHIRRLTLSFSVTGSQSRGCSHDTFISHFPRCGAFEHRIRTTHGESGIFGGVWITGIFAG